MKEELYFKFEKIIEEGLVLCDLMRISIELVTYLKENGISHDIDKVFDFILDKKNLSRYTQKNEYIESLLVSQGLDHAQIYSILEYLNKFSEELDELGGGFQDDDDELSVIHFIKEEDRLEMSTDNFNKLVETAISYDKEQVNNICGNTLVLEFMVNEVWCNILKLLKEDIINDNLRDKISFEIDDNMVSKLYCEDMRMGLKGKFSYESEFKANMRFFMNSNKLYDVEINKESDGCEKKFVINIYYCCL